jgi:orotidine-5'-phosphate decarboxylase
VNFADRLIESIRTKGSPCVVGIDPDLSLFPSWCTGLPPEVAVLDFCRAVLDAVAPLVPIVKPQAAFFEQLGPNGFQVLDKVQAYAKELGLLVLLDAKRGDISSTAKAYAEAYISKDSYNFDAITLNPYLGPDSIEPFVEVAKASGAGLFVIAMTSNPGASVLQKSAMATGEPLFMRVAEMLLPMVDSLVGSAGYSSLGVVAGATYPSEAAELRQKLPHSFFLVPGMGAQGGDASSLREFFKPDGLGAIVSNSRGITYCAASASSPKETSVAVSEATKKFVEIVAAR